MASAIATRVDRRPSPAELRRAWRAVQAGDFSLPGDSRRVRSLPGGWRPAAGERVLPLVKSPGSCGATTVAVALASVAGGSSRVVECCSPTGSGLAAAAEAELGVGPSGWTRGRRGRVLLDRCADIVLSVADVPPPSRGDGPGLTVLDVTWDPAQVLSSPGWLRDQLSQSARVVVVAAPTTPSLRHLDVLASLLPKARLVVTVVGRPVKRWPPTIRQSLGSAAREVLADGRLVRFPSDPRWAVTGLTVDPLPSRLVDAARQLHSVLFDAPVLDPLPLDSGGIC